MVVCHDGRILNDNALVMIDLKTKGDLVKQSFVKIHLAAT